MEEFNVRNITTVNEFENIVCKTIAKEDWRPGLKDPECFLACDPTGTYLGELNGEPVGFIMLTKYGESFGHIGCLMVKKEYRGRKYGSKILDAALASTYSMKPSLNITVVALASRRNMMEKRGFSSHFDVSRFDFHPHTAINCLSEMSEKTPLNIKCIDQVDEKALHAYDSSVFGYARHAFLSKWLRAEGSHTRVAVDKEGSIVGYVVARATFVKEDGYRLGPLFADSESIAEKLLKSVFEVLLQQDDSPTIVCIRAPTQKFMKLAERFQGKCVWSEDYMTTKGLPNMCFNKTFGFTTLESG